MAATTSAAYDAVLRIGVAQVAGQTPCGLSGPGLVAYRRFERLDANRGDRYLGDCGLPPLTETVQGEARSSIYMGVAGADTPKAYRPPNRADAPVVEGLHDVVHHLANGRASVEPRVHAARFGIWPRCVDGRRTTAPTLTGGAVARPRRRRLPGFGPT